MTSLETLERMGERFALDAPVDRKRMLVIANPHATTVSDRLRSLVVYALQGRYDVDAVDTQSRGHATMLCREAAEEGYDVVVAFGGDGTVNEAANGLVGRDTPLTCLPGGATNVYGRMLGIPTDIVDATEHLLHLADDWHLRRVDLARVNDRHFTFSAGFGLDASVVRTVDAHPAIKARFKHWYFTYAAVSTFGRDYLRRPPRIVVDVGGSSVAGMTVIVQNGDPYSYFGSRPLHVAPATDLASGVLSGVVLRRAGPLDVPTLMTRMLVERFKVVDHRHVTGFGGVGELRCTSSDGRPVPIQVDGDHIGDETEAVFGISPAALTVLA